MPGLLRIVALAVAANAAPANTPPLVEIPAPARTGEALTVYAGDLALITETRRGTLPAGMSRVRFTDLPDGIDPGTVRFLPPVGSATVLEQVWRTDVITPQRLLEASLGREVTLVTEPASGSGTPTRTKAKLVSLAEGPVWQTSEGIEIGHPGRVVVPELPAHLLPRPALEWLISSPSAGSGDFEASYLSSGVGWSAEHILELTEDAERGRLSTWVTVANHGGTSFGDASLRLVAGTPHRVAGKFRPVAAPPMRVMAMSEGMAADSEAAFVEESTFEYHTYTLGRRVSLPDGQAKQLALHESETVPIERRYILASPGWGGGRMPGEPAPIPVQVRLDFANTRAAGLGVPLPGGLVRIYQRASAGGSASDPLFLGEDRLPHTAVDEKRSLLAGMSFDVVADRRQTHYEEQVRTREVGFEIKVRNQRSRPVRVEVLETLHGEWRITQSSHPHEKRDAMTVAFPLDVKAGGETVLTWRARLE